MILRKIHLFDRSILSIPSLSSRVTRAVIDSSRRKSAESGAKSYTYVNTYTRILSRLHTERRPSTDKFLLVKQRSAEKQKEEKERRVRGDRKLPRARGTMRGRNVTAGCRPAVIINELPIDRARRGRYISAGERGRSCSYNSRAQLEGRNSKRIIDRAARPVAAFQRFTASGTTSISLRQSLPTPPKSHDRARAHSAGRRSGPNPKASIAAIGGPRGPSLTRGNRHRDDQLEGYRTSSLCAAIIARR